MVNQEILSWPLNKAFGNLGGLPHPSAYQLQGLAVRLEGWRRNRKKAKKQF
jgi:hypothetical protein